MKASLRRLENVEIRAIAATTVESTKPIAERMAVKPASQSWGAKQYLYRGRKTPNLIIMVRTYPTPEDSLQTEQILKNNQLLCISGRVGDGDEPLKTDELIVTLESPKHSNRPGDRGKVQWMQPGGTWSTEIKGRNRIGETGPTILSEMMEGCNDKAISGGYVGYYTLLDYFDATSKIRIQESKELVEVVTISPFGRLTAWLDPQKGGLPRKLILRKEGGDLFHSGKTLREIVMKGDKDFYPNGGVETITYSADDIELAESDGVWWIKKVSLVTKTVTSAGPEVTVTTDVEIEGADFDIKTTESDFSPSLKIPKNYPVTIVGREGLNFMWNGSKVVPGGGGS